MSDGPPEVWFYHLERTSLDQALPELLEKTLARGWRALVRGGSAERLEHLDGWLWSYRDDSFLPHGVDTEPSAERQPILITTGLENPNRADALFLIDDAEPGEIAEYERCVLLFDGRDEAAVAAARKRWPTFKAAGCQVSYWRQGETGAWRKEA
ncbi:MAG TPA: DNA polymerase III subunit chi [Caulobacteraceae bacterium]|jgi:DNA polymerase-3 subunit chi|nr:DNA polymerase III subunit chi [Caulobacteraceae bacterium]